MNLPLAATFREPNAIGNCCPNLERHRSKNDMPDMVISTKGNSKVFAHRLILGSRFDKLATRLSGPITRRNTKLNWLAFEHGIIETLVRFAYTGEIEVNLETAFQLFLCAWNVGSEFVSTCVSQFLVERANLDNINLIWTMADITHSDIAKSGCVGFISANFEQIISTNLLNRLDVRTLSSVLKHESKAVSSEEVVIRSITNWTKYMGHSKTEFYRINYFSELCSLVDWTKVPLYYITNLLFKEQFLISHEKVREEVVKVISANAIQIQTSKTRYAIGPTEELVKRINANVRPIEISKTLYAIFLPESAPLSSVMKFELGKLAEYTVSGYVEVANNSRTVSLKGVIFLIGGSNAGSSKRVTTFNVITEEKGQVADLEVGRSWGHIVAASSDEIFVCGGWDEKEVVSKACEVFHPGDSCSWKRLPDLRQGRASFAAAYLPDDAFLLVTGGNSDCGTEHFSSCEMLNTASQSEGWRPMAAMQEARHFHGAVYFEGRVFVAGGSGLTSCEFFTPPPVGSTTELGQWTRILSKMTRSMWYIKSTIAVSANEILVFGTTEGNTVYVEQFQNNTTSFSEEGDFELWSWTQLPPIVFGKKGWVMGVHRVN